MRTTIDMTRLESEDAQIEASYLQSVGIEEITETSNVTLDIPDEKRREIEAHYVDTYLPLFIWTPKQ